MAKVQISRHHGKSLRVKQLKKLLKLYTLSSKQGEVMHKDNGTRCLVVHDDEQGQCIGCVCGEYHRPIEFLKLAAPTEKGEK